jgi:hypothetical protein
MLAPMLARLSSILLAGALLTGCVTRVKQEPTVPAEHRGPIKLHLVDGRLVVLDQWTAATNMVRGTGREYGVERQQLRSGSLEVPRSDVALVETSHKELNLAIIPMALATGASVAMTAVCLKNTKSCFGSCPTFYVPAAGGGWALQAEGFSSSIARALESDDLDDLPDARPEGGAITMAMRNEALETHFVRALSLQVVRGPAGSTVLRGFGPGYLAVGSMAPPEATDLPGAREALAEKDGAELMLDADPEDLARRISITLRYPAPFAREAALVVSGRNSLMSTYVLYQMIALLGRGYGELLAAVERGDLATTARLVDFDRVLGGVEVETRQKGSAFHRVGTMGYIGPIARATRAISFEVEAPAEPVEVRLTFARAHWKLDAARLAPVLAQHLHADEVLPEIVTAKGRDPAEVRASLRGQGERVATLPGDEIVLRFPVDPPSSGSVGYFLKSRGYYYEWMRDEWLREEDPARARIYLDDAARALRELAPAYKKLEGSMESVFRASRFGRSP